jgi:hypothetical protein
MAFRDYIFNLFPPYYKENDSYKDGNGEGLFERYTRSFGEELDYELIPKLENYLNELDPSTASSDMLRHLSDCLGNPPDIFLDENQYRNMLRYAVDVYKIKGTLGAYQLLFSLLGYSVNVTEYPPDLYLYDDSWLYDDTDPYYDSACPLCSEYSLMFTNTANPLSPISSTILALLEAIVYWVEPINARLRNLINTIQTSDQVSTCVKENIVIKRIVYSTYDDSLVYDTVNLAYEDIVSLTILQTLNFNCQGSPTQMGIGSDTIGFDLIVY